MGLLEIEFNGDVSCCHVGAKNAAVFALKSSVILLLFEVEFSVLTVFLPISVHQAIDS